MRMSLKRVNGLCTVERRCCGYARPLRVVNGRHNRSAVGQEQTFFSSQNHLERLRMWNFDQPPNCATIVSRSIVHNGQPILLVTHDEDDHGWQFLDGSNPPTEALMVCLSHAVDLDPSVSQLADLPPGWLAWRESVEGPWLRQQNDADNEY